jgi:hypothetical protein
MGGQIYNASMFPIEYLVCGADENIFQNIPADTPQFNVSLEDIDFNGFQNIHNFIIDPHYNNLFRKVNPKSKDS